MAGTYNIAANLINILVRELNFALSKYTHRIERRSWEVKKLLRSKQKRNYKA